MKYIYLAIAFIFFNCSPDLGNYEYKNLNELTIEGISDLEVIEVYAYEDYIKIEPKITGSNNGEDLSALEYEWRLIPFLSSDKESEDEKYVISREKNLNTTLALSAQKYYGTFKVTDKSTNNIYVKRFFVEVKTSISTGWAILCEEDDGAPHLDWIHSKNATEDIIALDIWRNYTEEYKANLGKPISIGYSFVAGRNEEYRLINFEKGSYNVDDTMLLASESRSMRFRMGYIQDQVHVRALSQEVQLGPSINIFIDKNGDLYRKEFAPGTVYDKPCNSFGYNMPKFRLAPFYATLKWKGWSDKHSLVFYDQDNCRFVEMRNANKYLSEIKFLNENDNIFEPTTNKEMVYMETRLNGNTVAILKDKSTKKLSVYVFKINMLNPGQTSNVVQVSYNELIGADTDKITCFSYDKLYNYLYYASGENLYRFVLTNKGEEVVAKKIITLPGEDIVVLKHLKLQAFRVPIPWEVACQDDLYVASNKVNSPSYNSGIIRSYVVTPLEADLVLKKEIKDKGFSKIVDMAYFEKQ